MCPWLEFDADSDEKNIFANFSDFLGIKSEMNHY